MGDSFRSRVNTNVVPLDRPNPNASRSGLGEGLQDLGAGLGRAAAIRDASADDLAASQHRIAMEEERRARAARASELAAELAEEEATIEAELDDLRTNSKPGAVGYQLEATKLINERYDTFAQKLGEDPEILQRFGPVLAGKRAGLRLREERWERASRAKYQGDNLQRFQDATGNALLADPTPDRLQESIDAGRASIDLLDVDGTTRDAILADVEGGLVRNYLDGLFQQGNHAAVRVQVESGKLDAYIDPKAKTAYLRQADAADRQAQIQIEQQASRVRDEARDAAKAAKARIDAGVVPTPAEMRATRDAMQAAGVDEAELVQFDALSTSVEVNRQYQAVPDETVRRDRDMLLSKQAAGKASDGEQMRLAQLNKLVDARDERAAAGLRETAARGPQGQLAALEAIDQMGGDAEQRYARAEKLGNGLGAAAMLGPIERRRAVEGGDIRKARPKDFGDQGKDVGPAMMEALGPVAAALGGQYAEVQATAWNIMTQAVAQRGGVGFDAEEFKRSVGVALGARRRPQDGAIVGGVGTISHGHKVLLPSWQTAREFDTALAQSPFDNAVYRNGRAAVKADILRNYRPIYAGDDAQGRSIYHMIDAEGGVLQAKNGGPYPLIAQRPRGL